MHIGRPKANAWSFELPLDSGVRIATEPPRIALVAAKCDARDWLALKHIHTHTHTHMYVPSTLPAPHAMHTLSSLAFFSQHSVLHAAPQDAYTTYPWTTSALGAMHTHTTNAKRKGRGWKREVLSSL